MDPVKVSAEPGGSLSESDRSNLIKLRKALHSLKGELLGKSPALASKETIAMLQTVTATDSAVILNYLKQDKCPLEDMQKVLEALLSNKIDPTLTAGLMSFYGRTLRCREGLDQRCIDGLKRNLLQWFSLLTPKMFGVDRELRQVSIKLFEAIQVAAGTVDFSDDPKWDVIKLEIKTRQVGIIKELMRVNEDDSDWSDLWCIIVNLMGREILHNRDCLLLFNSMLSILSEVFKKHQEKTTQTVSDGFRCWKILVELFFQNRDLLKDKHYKLLMNITKNRPKVDDTPVLVEAKARLWWCLLRHLNPESERFLTVVVNFLQFCCDMVVKCDPKFCCEAVGLLLGEHLSITSEHKYELAEPDFPRSIPNKECFIKLYQKLFSFFEQLFTTLQFDHYDYDPSTNFVGLIESSWSRMLSYVSEVLRSQTVNSHSTDVIKALLMMLGRVGFCDNEAFSELSRRQGLLLTVPPILVGEHSIPDDLLTSNKYYSGEGLMVGTPALYLTKMLLTRHLFKTRLRENEYLVMVHHLIRVSVLAPLTGIEYIGKVMTILEERAKECDGSNATIMESVIEIWRSIAVNLNEVLKSGGSINSSTHDLSWLYSVITFPVVNYMENTGPKGDAAIEYLKELLDQVHISRKNVSLESDEICESISARLLTLLEDHPKKLLGVANAMTQIICSSANDSREGEDLFQTMDLLCKVSELLNTSQLEPRSYLDTAVFLCNSVGAIARGWADTDALFLRLVPVVKTLYDFRGNRNSSYDDRFLLLCRQLWNTYLVKRHNQSSLAPEVKQAVGDLVVMVKELMTKVDTSEGRGEHPDIEVIDDFENATAMMYYIMPVLSEEPYVPSTRRILAARNNTNAPIVTSNGVRRITTKLLPPRGVFREAEPQPMVPTYAISTRDLPSPDIIIIDAPKKVEDDDVICLSPVVKSQPFPISSPVDPSKSVEGKLGVPVPEQLGAKNFANFHLRPLTKHQKERMKRRSDDIPALYGDLTQDTQSNTQFGESSSTQETITIPERFVGSKGVAVESDVVDNTQDSNVAQEPFVPSGRVTEVDLTRPFSGIFPDVSPSLAQARANDNKSNSIFKLAKQEKMSPIQLKRVYQSSVQTNKKNAVLTRQGHEVPLVAASATTENGVNLHEETSKGLLEGCSKKTPGIRTPLKRFKPSQGHIGILLPSCETPLKKAVLVNGGSPSNNSVLVNGLITPTNPPGPSNGETLTNSPVHLRGLKPSTLPEPLISVRPNNPPQPFSGLRHSNLAVSLGLSGLKPSIVPEHVIGINASDSLSPSTGLMPSNVPGNVNVLKAILPGPLSGLIPSGPPGPISVLKPSVPPGPVNGSQVSSPLGVSIGLTLIKTPLPVLENNVTPSTTPLLETCPVTSTVTDSENVDNMLSKNFSGTKFTPSILKKGATTSPDSRIEVVPLSQPGGVSKRKQRIKAALLPMDDTENAVLNTSKNIKIYSSHDLKSNKPELSSEIIEPTKPDDSIFSLNSSFLNPKESVSSAIKHEDSPKMESKGPHITVDPTPSNCTEDVTKYVKCVDKADIADTNKLNMSLSKGNDASMKSSNLISDNENDADPNRCNPPLSKSVDAVTKSDTLVSNEDASRFNPPLLKSVETSPKNTNLVSDSQDFVDSSQESIRSVKITLEKLPDIPPGGNAIIAREGFVSRGPEEGSPIRIHRHSPIPPDRASLVKKVLQLDAETTSDNARRSTGRAYLKRKLADLGNEDAQNSDCSNTSEHVFHPTNTEFLDGCSNVTPSKRDTNVSLLVTLDDTGAIENGVPFDVSAQKVSFKLKTKDTSINSTPDSSPSVQPIEPLKLSLKKRKFVSTNDIVTPVKIAKITDVRTNSLVLNNISKLRTRTVEVVTPLSSPMEILAKGAEGDDFVTPVKRVKLSVPTCDTNNALELNILDELSVGNDEKLASTIDLDGDAPKNRPSDEPSSCQSESVKHISKSDSHGASMSDHEVEGSFDRVDSLLNTSTNLDHTFAKRGNANTNMSTASARQLRELKNLKIDFAPSALKMPKLRRRKSDQVDICIEISDTESVDSVDSQKRVPTRRSKVKLELDQPTDDKGKRISSASPPSEKHEHNSVASVNNKLNTQKADSTKSSTKGRNRGRLSKQLTNSVEELDKKLGKKQSDQMSNDTDCTTLIMESNAVADNNQTTSVRGCSMEKNSNTLQLDSDTNTDHKHLKTPPKNCTKLLSEVETISPIKLSETPKKSCINVPLVDTSILNSLPKSPLRPCLSSFGINTITTTPSKEFEIPWRTNKSSPSKVPSKHLRERQRRTDSTLSMEMDVTSNSSKLRSPHRHTLHTPALPVERSLCIEPSTVLSSAVKSVDENEDSLVVVPDSQPVSASKSSPVKSEDNQQHMLLVAAVGHKEIPSLSSSRVAKRLAEHRGSHRRHNMKHESRSQNIVRLGNEKIERIKASGIEADTAAPSHESRSQNIVRLGNEKIERIKASGIEADTAAPSHESRSQNIVRLGNEKIERIKASGIEADTAAPSPPGMKIDYETCVETTTDSNGLNVSRPWVKGVWSPSLQPDRPILKSVSPAERRRSFKRVNFPDEFVVTKELVFNKSKKSSQQGRPLEIVAFLECSTLDEGEDRSAVAQEVVSLTANVESPSKSVLAAESQETQETQDIVSPVPLALPRPELLNEKDAFYPPLIDCEKPVIGATQFMVTPTWRNNLYRILKEDLIETVGDFCRLTERQIFRLPLKEPKIETAMKTLKKYRKCLIEDEHAAREREHIPLSELERVMMDKNPKEVTEALQNLPNSNDYLNYIFERMSRTQKLHGIDYTFLIKHILRLCDATEIFDALAAEYKKKGASFLESVLQYVSNSNEDVKELVACGIKGMRSEDFVTILIESGKLETLNLTAERETGPPLLSYVLRKQDCADVLNELKQSGKFNVEATKFIVQNVDTEDILAQLHDLGRLCGIDTSALCKRLDQSEVLSYIVQEHKTEDICEKLPLQELLTCVGSRATSLDLLGLLKDSGNLQASTKFTVDNEQPENLFKQLKDSDKFETFANFVVENEKPEKVLCRLKSSGNLQACTQFVVENENPVNCLNQLKDSGNFEECTTFVIKNANPEVILNHLKDSGSLESCTSFVFDNERTGTLLNQLDNSGKLQECTKLVIERAKSEDILNLVSENLSEDPTKNANGINQLLTSYCNKFGFEKYFEIYQKHLAAMVLDSRKAVYSLRESETLE